MKSSTFIPAIIAAVIAVASPPQAVGDTLQAEATDNATILTTGPRTGFSGTNFFNVVGSAGTVPGPSFGVADFSATSFNLSYPVATVTSLTLSLTQSLFNAAAGSLAFYLTEANTVGIHTGSPLVYQTANGPEGLGTQLDPKFTLGIGTFTPATNGTVDTYTFTLNDTVESYVIGQLNSGGTLRIVVTATTPGVVATWSGFTNSGLPGPTLTLDATLARPELVWKGGPGVWLPSGGTDWSGGSWSPNNVAVFNTGAGEVALGGAITAIGLQFDTTGYTISGSGANTLTLAGGPAGANTIAVSNATDTATISATLAGATGLKKTGTGTLILSGTNVYTGPITLNGGTLSVSMDANLGAVDNDLVFSGGALRATDSFTLNANRDLSGTAIIGVAAGETLTVLSSPVLTSLRLTDAGTLKTTGQLVTPSVFFENGAILDASGGFTGGRVSINGNGTVLMASNSASDGFTLGSSAATNPIAVIDSSDDLGAAQFRFNGGTLQVGAPLTGANAITTEVSLGGNGTITGANVEFTNFTIFGTTATRTLNVQNAQTVISGPIVGTAGLTKTGPGVLVLSADSSGFTGAFNANGGTTLLAGPTAALGGAVNVGSGGTFAGGGTVTGALTVMSGGTVDPNVANGVLNAGSFDLQSGGALAITLGQPASDQLAISGAVTLAGDLVLSLATGYQHTPDQLLFVLLNGDVDPIIGTFAGLPQGATTIVGNNAFQISYIANSATNSFTGGNDVALLAVLVPEPSATLFLVGFASLTMLRRRRAPAFKNA